MKHEFACGETVLAHSSNLLPSLVDEIGDGCFVKQSLGRRYSRSWLGGGQHMASEAYRGHIMSFFPGSLSRGAIINTDILQLTFVDMGIVALSELYTAWENTCSTPNSSFHEVLWPDGVSDSRPTDNNHSTTAIWVQQYTVKDHSTQSRINNHSSSTLRLNNLHSKIIRYRAYSQQSFDFKHSTQHHTINNHSNEGIQLTVNPKFVAFRLNSNIIGH